VFPELSVTLAQSAPDGGDRLRSLHTWLSREPELRGRVSLHRRDPEPGTLGAVADAVLVAGPVVTALVPALISWIRARTTDVSLTVRRPDGMSAEISAQRVRRLSADQLGAEIERLVQAVGAAPTVTPSGAAAVTPSGAAAQPDAESEAPR
jgi:hypothetical protein